MLNWDPLFSLILPWSVILYVVPPPFIACCNVIIPDWYKSLNVLSIRPYSLPLIKYLNSTLFGVIPDICFAESAEAITISDVAIPVKSTSPLLIFVQFVPVKLILSSSFSNSSSLGIKNSFWTPCKIKDPSLVVDFANIFVSNVVFCGKSLAKKNNPPLPKSPASPYLSKIEPLAITVPLV